MVQRGKWPDVRALAYVRAIVPRPPNAAAMPLWYSAELIGVGGDSEKVIRWLIAHMVLTCDRLAITLTAAASARSRCASIGLVIRGKGQRTR